MRQPDQRQLRKELQLAGAADVEINELVPLAASLGRLKTSTLVSDDQTTPMGPHWPRLARVAGIAFAGLIVGLLLIVFSQGVLPGSPLYPVQKLSDRVAITVHPAYRATVMMRRAQQVSALVEARAGSDIILTTLQDYTATARTYATSTHTSYAAFEYCKASLQQAATAASPAVRQAIQRDLRPLDSI